MNNNHYNKNLRQFAHELRTTSSSKGERRIWKSLLSRGRLGVKFKRQRPIDRYIVDFFSAEIKLIVEIDGSSHLTKGSADLYRESVLKGLGYSIIRFSEGEVIYQLDDVEKRLSHVIYSLKDRQNQL